MPLNTAPAAVTPEAPARPLVLRDVGKRYGRGEYVLRGLSTTFAPGTATALVGPNGSGKTTLLRLLTCLSFPTEGHIHYGDPASGEALDIHRQPYRYLAHVGVAYDGAELPDRLSAEESLAWILRARGGWDANAPARIAAVLDAVQLDERRSQPVGTYSTGMRQKTQLAAAFVARPAVLLLDEPFRGLDAAATEALLAHLAEFKRAGGLLLLSSHQAPVLDALADERLVMGRGEGVESRG